jgi:5-methylcytosine-specific restriction endonuclease McrA
MGFMIRPRKKPRPGRLKGVDLYQLRTDCYYRDNGMCQRCGKLTYLALPYTAPNSAHMSHKTAKGRGGDSLSNVEILCGDCHRRFHNYGPSMEKPCPRKVQDE